jgi:c-di-GMP-binding flagellar brake protein YcgR
MGKIEKESKPHFGTVNFERRKRPRLSVALPVEYWRSDNPTSHQGRTADIGEGWLLLYISEDIEVGQNLRVKLFLDSGPKLKTIEAQALIVWKDFGLRKEGYYRIGVRFVNISLEDMEKLRSFLNNPMNAKIPSGFNVPSKFFSALGISNLGDSTCLTPKEPDQN